LSAFFAPEEVGTVTRRFFAELLVTVGAVAVACVVGIPAVLSGLSPILQRGRRENWQPIGRLEDFPIGRINEEIVFDAAPGWPPPVRERAVFVSRRSETDILVFARSCTDLSCPLDYDSGSRCFFCPCHGGIFDEDGTRLAGPTRRPMYRYAHRVRGGVVEIDLSSIPPSA
jgi:menaquinol-cytochrome c reductase iron-sulfur subunit